MCNNERPKADGTDSTGIALAGERGMAETTHHFEAIPVSKLPHMVHVMIGPL